MSMLCYTSPAHSIEGQLQKWKHILTPLLQEILDNDVEILIDVDNNNNLCINNVPIGNIELISNFEVYDYEYALVSYSYNGKQRLIDFGELYDFFKPLRKSGVVEICELQPNGERTIIYSKLKSSVQ